MSVYAPLTAQQVVPYAGLDVFHPPVGPRVRLARGAGNIFAAIATSRDTIGKVTTRCNAKLAMVRLMSIARIAGVTALAIASSASRSRGGSHAHNEQFRITHARLQCHRE